MGSAASTAKVVTSSGDIDCDKEIYSPPRITSPHSTKTEIKASSNNFLQQQQPAEQFYRNEDNDFDDRQLHFDDEELCEEDSHLYNGILINYRDERNDIFDDEFTYKHKREAAETFTHTAMSLDIDNDDLLFNLLHFNKDKSPHNNDIFIESIINNITSETIALHSEHNTPYKIKPLGIDVLNSLSDKYRFTVNSLSQISEDKVFADCMVCMEMMTVGDDVICLRGSCGHSFHKNCLLKWLTLQSHCPVCRKKVFVEGDDNDAHLS